MKLRAWTIKFLFPNTVAAHAMRDAERCYPGVGDFVRVPLHVRYDLGQDAQSLAAAKVIEISRPIQSKETPQ